jgi:hypothetical protein
MAAISKRFELEGWNFHAKNIIGQLEDTLL